MDDSLPSKKKQEEKKKEEEKEKKEEEEDVELVIPDRPRINGGEGSGMLFVCW